MSDIKNIAAAFVKAQAEIESAVKDKKNPAFRSTYADLLAVVEAVKPSLAKHGLGFIQEVTEREAGGVYVETVLVHTSGEILRTGKLPIPAGKADAHGYGSAITYGKRYSLMAALGVPAEDDDGNAASGTDKKFASPVKSAQEGVTYTKEQHERVSKIANALVAHVQAEAMGEDRSYNIREELEGITDADEKLLLWDKLQPHSGVRARIKAAAKAAA